MKIVDAQNNFTYESVSRWIKIEYVTVTNRNINSIYSYCEIGESVPAFRYKNKRYYIRNFERLCSPIKADGILITGTEIGQYYNPLLLEVSNSGEAIRLWQSITD